MNAPSPIRLVAVVGGSGAGKSWLVERLCTLLGGDAAALQLDDFYRDRSHLSLRRRARLNFDLPGAIDWVWAERVLRDCRAGRPTQVPAYDFATHSRVAERTAWTPRPLVFVEGLWLLRPPAIRALFDLRIFLDAPAELRCERRLARDVAERGYSAEAVAQQLRTAVVPMHERYVEPQKKWADAILTQPFREADLEALADRLHALLESSAPALLPAREAFRAGLLSALGHHEYCH